MAGGSFDMLSPDLAAGAVEEAYGLGLDGSVQVYPSYVNRVYGLRDEEGRPLVAKFYRPGRWSREALEDEHRFLADCREAELPVAAPLPNGEGETISELVFEREGEDARAGGEPEAGEEEVFRFALFPRMGGRNFEPETDGDWLRLGALASRLHAVGRRRAAPARLRLGPELAESHLAEILGLVHADLRAEFEELAREALALAAPRFGGVALQRVHGDLHRGNVLDRPGEGLVILDFDDMTTAPPAQDLWLLLPGRAGDCARELALLEEGYSEFGMIDPTSYALFEPLRLYRMLYFLTWRARQRGDYWFKREFPDWGSKAFWLQETGDLREELDALGARRAGGW
ncbi:MAG: serine/threonine protein kinase [Spirochaetaceae bacterium]|nr:serine/threonine protein kinase [Spirochaetaceae bacterium]